MTNSKISTENEEKKPQTSPAEGATPGSMESGATKETPAVKTLIEDPCDVRDALAIIKAVGDSLVCIHAAKHYGGIEADEETIQTLGFLLIAKARCAAETLGESLDD